MSWWFGAGVALLALVCIFLARFFLILGRNETPEARKRGSASILVVIGSGGHTTEILRLVGSLSASYSPRHYVIAETDRMSEDKVRTLEAARAEEGPEPQFTIHRIPRSREVRQSWVTSVVSTLFALLYSIPLVFQLKPDVRIYHLNHWCTKRNKNRKYWKHLTGQSSYVKRETVQVKDLSSDLKD
ncbi:UDP-N-acetylglucosamine transferase subunit ALG14 homolog isoform X2 [Mobula hypostoma]|uniref:UDP-N-acetylglucosamine transferase subunit ALG14 homolog isoform X2 n=1 Tax=Mobula hypostoma TaxID=723540 RepID=UPI002FC2F273